MFWNGQLETVKAQYPKTNYRGVEFLSTMEKGLRGNLPGPPGKAKYPCRPIVN